MNLLRYLAMPVTQEEHFHLRRQYAMAGDDLMVALAGREPSIIFRHASVFNVEELS